MTQWTLIRRSLRYHARLHVGVWLGAVVGSAALIGALVVGDSVRESLREQALARLGWVDAAMAPADRVFTEQLAKRLNAEVSSVELPHNRPHIAVLLKVPGTAARSDDIARANHVNIFGVMKDFWQSRRDSIPLPAFAWIPKGAVVFNEALAAQLRAHPGDEVVLRMHKPTALSRDIPITPQSDASLALRVKVHAIAPAERMGNFSLQVNQVPALNAFLNYEDLAEAVGMKGKANVVLAGEYWIEHMDWDFYDSSVAGWARIKAWLQWFQWFLGRLAGRPASHWAYATSQVTATSLGSGIQSLASLADYQLELRGLTNAGMVELRSERIFLDPAVLATILDPEPNEWSRHQNEPSPGIREPHASEMRVRARMAQEAKPILTYLVNELRAGARATPYSMVAAVGPPWTPPDLRDDEIVVNQWLADDLQLKPGDAVDLAYFIPESGARLIERTNRFRVRVVVPLSGVYVDRNLMPEFPGIAKAESTHEWDAGFPLVHKIREKDEDYWKKYRGTPKAFVSWPAGRTLWANRFGDATAVRFPVLAGAEPRSFINKVESVLRQSLDPAAFGLRFEPVREQALKAAAQSQDFGGLFLGFSFFLIIAALLLMALLFQLGLEQRATEVGTLLALGIPPRQVRRWLLLEGAAIAFLGGVVGALGGAAYAKAMVHGLTTIWREAVGAAALSYHATTTSLAIGLVASTLVSAGTIWLTLRQLRKRTARELLAEGAEERGWKLEDRGWKHRRSGWIAGVAGVGAVSLVGWAFWKKETAAASVFFGAGALLLVAGLSACAVLLAALMRSETAEKLTLNSLGLRNCARRRKRSLTTIGLLACGSFLVAAIGVFRLDANQDAEKRSSGTGGFALIGETSMPVVHDLNSQRGREFFGLDDKALAGVSFVPFRVREGDDASCLNLNRAQKPRLLGVKPELLSARGAFTFAKTTKGWSREQGWKLLAGVSSESRLQAVGQQTPPEGGTPNEIPAIGDLNSILWALGKNVGDTLDYVDERGRPFKVRLVGAVANSILQGNLIIDEAEFVRRFPSGSGYRMFLIDAPSNSVAQVSGSLSRALQDVGLELTPAPRRLAAFNAVQNTYLGTFQVLGGFGLLLGSAGLGVVVLRNVFERRSELALMQAVGFRARLLQWLVLSEHAVLLWLGLSVGVAAALVAVLPSLWSPGTEVPYRSLALTLGGVLVSGMVWTWAATRSALRGRLLEALRNE